MTQYRIEKRLHGFEVQVRNEVIGVGVWWSTVRTFRTLEAAKRYLTYCQTASKTAGTVK